MKALRAPAASNAAPWQLEVAAGWLEGVEAKFGSLASLPSLNRPVVEETQMPGQLKPIFDRARALASKEGAAEEERLSAIRLLGRGVEGRDTDVQILASLLKPSVPAACQTAALDALKRLREPSVADGILGAWPELSPKLRTPALGILLSRDEWTGKLLDALERGVISPAEIAPVHQQTLLTGKSDVVGKRAEKIFASRQTNRQQLVSNYEKSRDLLGDAAHGAALFRQNCMTCHKLKGEGFAVGPDLGTVADKPIGTLLVAILDPNQAIDAAYQNYTLATRSGRELSGIIASDTAAGITIRAAGGVEETVPRSDIARLASSKLSLMPEGLEAVLPPQDMADLIAFIRSH